MSNEEPIAQKQTVLCGQVNSHFQNMAADIIRKGDLAAVRNLLEQGLDPRTRSAQPLLHVACEQENEEIVRLLLQYGADANERCVYDMTPLSICLQTENLAAIPILLEFGADPNGIVGYTFLYLACLRKMFDVALLLIRYGADMNRKNKHGFSTFDSVAMDGNRRQDILRFLLMNGAHIRVDNMDKFPKKVKKHLTRVKRLSVLCACLDRLPADLIRAYISFF